MRVLVVDDEPVACRSLARCLTYNSFQVDVATDWEEAELLATRRIFDLIILDLVMPGKDGVEICKTLRERRVSTPILMLSAHDEAEHKIRCLDAGADDFLAKQSRTGELLARVRALLRRPRPYEASELRVGELVLDTLARRVRRGGRELELTSRELASPRS